MESGNEHWERRYYAAIERFSSEERNWQRLYMALRRLIQRLLLTSRGRDERIDRLLGQVRNAVGERSDEGAVEAAVTALSEAIRDLDLVHGGAPTAEPAATRAAEETVDAHARAETDSAAGTVVGALLLRILERLALIPELTEAAAQLRAAIEAAGAEALTEQADRIAELVNRQCALLIADKARVESLLLQVTEHLGELERYLQGHGEQVRAGRDARQELQARVAAEVEGLNEDSASANQLDALQSRVRTRLATIGEHLAHFQQREEARENDWQQRTARMSARISELERTAESLERSLREQRRQAITDQLTGIANRAAFEERIAEACRRLNRSGLNASLLVLDIDRFKTINDRYGHVTGDRALRIVAQQLHAELRETDFLARYGGEEFVILLEAVEGGSALAVAEKLRQRIGQLRFRVHDDQVNITLSIGVTSLRRDELPEVAFERADRALYRAKAEGRDRCAMD